MRSIRCCGTWRTRFAPGRRSKSRNDQLSTVLSRRVDSNSANQVAQVAPRGGVMHNRVSRGEVAEPGLRRTPGTRVDSKGSRGFESPPLRQAVWHVSLHYREAMRSARGARFGRGRGPGECQRRLLSAKFAQDSLFAILACPSADRPTMLREAKYVLEPLTQATQLRKSIGVPELAVARSRAGAVRFFGSSLEY